MSSLHNPKIAILFLALIVLVVPFYESERIVKWGIQEEVKNDSNFFTSLALTYARNAEQLKLKMGLDDFFEQESDFWLAKKESPIVFKEEPIEIVVRPIEPIMTTTTGVLVDAKPESPFRVLIIGDSFMAVFGGVGDVMERELLDYSETTISRQGKVSSGLSRPDFFDWNVTVKELIAKHQPNVVISMMGANDPQSLTTPEGGWVASYGTEKWDQGYAQRMADFLTIFKEKNITVFWLGLPVMKEPIYAKKVKNLNSIYVQEIAKFENAHFISTWDLLADEQGNYTAYFPDEEGKQRLARASDGVHLQYFGGGILVKEVVKKMEEELVLEKDPA